SMHLEEVDAEAGVILAEAPAAEPARPTRRLRTKPTEHEFSYSALTWWGRGRRAPEHQNIVSLELANAAGSIPRPDEDRDVASIVRFALAGIRTRPDTAVPRTVPAHVRGTTGESGPIHHNADGIIASDNRWIGIEQVLITVARSAIW